MTTPDRLAQIRARLDDPSFGPVPAWDVNWLLGRLDEALRQVERLRGGVELVAAATPCTCSAQRARADRLATSINAWLTLALSGGRGPVTDDSLLALREWIEAGWPQDRFPEPETEPLDLDGRASECPDSQDTHPLVSLINALAATYSPRSVAIWLGMRNRHLAERRPIDLLAEGDFERVARAVEALDHVPVTSDPRAGGHR